MSSLRCQLCELIALGLALTVVWGCLDHRTNDVSSLTFTARQSTTQTTTISLSANYPLSEKGATNLTATSNSFHPQAPSVTLGGISFTVELAITSAERTKGLSGRNHLPPKSGMLFISNSGPIGAFWMKEMKFPLDLIWISEACFIVHITPDIPPPAPGTPDSQLGYYFSKEPAAFTLELNSGEAADNDISVGTRVYFTNIFGDSATRC